MTGAGPAACLSSHGGDIETALQAYEDQLFPRSTAAAIEANELVSLMLGDTAPFGLVDAFAQGMSAEAVRRLQGK